MNARRFSRAGVITAVVAILGLGVDTGLAEEDHLKGYKIKDLNQVAAPGPVTVTNEFGSESCELKKAQFFLVQSEKNGGDDPRGGQARELVCYKAKCTGTLPPVTAADSQFGVHSLETKKAKLVCLPVDRDRCGDGELDPGETCDGGADAACPGSCQPDCTCPSQVCGNSTLEGTENCDPPGSTSQCAGGVACPSDCTCPVCGDSTTEAPEQCDPPGNTTQCAGNTTCDPSCACPPPPACNASYPACDGTCPAGGSCVELAGGCFCDGGDCVGGTGPPTCDGSCAGDYECAAVFGCRCVILPPECGDWVVEGAEECDPPGNVIQCASGLACDGSCACPTCPGAAEGGFCWVLGGFGASCDDTCAGSGLTYRPATATYAGSGGTDANCIAVLDALGAPLGTQPFWSSIACDDLFPPQDGLGCGYVDATPISGPNRRGRCATPATTSDATYLYAQRACACQ